MFVNLTTQTVMNEATCYANEIMSGYGLGAQGECATRVGVLDNDYSRLSAAAQAEYNSNTSELFVNAEPVRLIWMNGYLTIHQLLY